MLYIVVVVIVVVLLFVVIVVYCCCCSLPKHTCKTQSVLKGFAFVEFSTVDGANRAIEVSITVTSTVEPL